MNTQQLLKFIKQYPFALLGGLCCVILAVTLFMRSSTLPALESNYENLNLEWGKINKNLLNGNLIEEDLAQLNELNEEIRGRLIDPTELVKKYQIMLRSLARRNQVDIGDPREGQLVGDDSLFTSEVDQLRYEFTVQGSFENAMKFIHDVRFAEFFTVVDGMNITPVGNPSQRGVTIKLTLRALAIPPQAG